MMKKRTDDELKEEILTVALTAFAKKGLSKTTISEIAKEAHTTSKTVNRLFSNKEEIFYQIVPQEFVSKIKSFLTNRVSLISKAQNLTDLSKVAEHLKISNEALDYMLANRLRLIILFAHPRGSVYTNLLEECAEILKEMALAQLQASGNSCQLTEAKNSTLLFIYKDYTKNIIRLLNLYYQDKNKLQQMLDEYSRYHLLGIRSYFL